MSSQNKVKEVIKPSYIIGKEAKPVHIQMHNFGDRSALVEAAGYNPLTKTLRIMLKTSTSVYDYMDVSPHRYAGLLMAKSMGQYYNRMIKGHKSAYLGIRDVIEDPIENDLEDLEEMFQDWVKDLNHMIGVIRGRGRK